MFDELEFEKFVNKGMISLGFNAQWRKSDGLILPVFVKITGNTGNTPYFSYSNNEVDVLRRLNAPPTIDTIPQLYWFVPSMANPFQNKVEYILRRLGVKKEKTANWLSRQDEISVQVLERGNHTSVPRSLDEFLVFSESVLKTLAFAHSRNISNADLSRTNCFFDGKKAFLFDWNDGAIVEGEGVTPLKLYEMVPPEARHLADKSKYFHPNVWAFDMWTTGVMFDHMLEKCCSLREERFRHSRTRQRAQRMVNLMLDRDPFRRAQANEVLQHSFFTKSRRN